MRVLLLALALAVPASANAQTVSAPNDGISRILREVERVLTTGDARAYAALVAPGANTSTEFHEEWLQAGVTRAVVQERLRAEIAGVAKGLAYDVYVDVLAEFGRNARVGTWLIRIFRETSDATEWRIARLNVLTTVRGLYRLSVNTEKQYRIVNLALSAEDFELRVPSGVAFVAETDAGVTGIVILGRGEMTFSPTPTPKKGRSGSTAAATSTRAASTGCTCARTLPSSTAGSTSARFTRATVDARDLRRAEAVFQENLPRSFGIELADLSRDRWSVIPKYGDLVAEMNTEPRASDLHEIGERCRGHPVLRSHAQPDDRHLPLEGKARDARPVFQRRRPGRLRHRQLRHRCELRSAARMDRRKGDAAR